MNTILKPDISTPDRRATTVFDIFAEAARLEAEHAPLYRQYSVLSDEYCESVGWVLEAADRGKREWLDSPIARGQVDEIGRELDPIRKAVKRVDNQFDTMRSHASEILQGANIVATIFSGTRGLLLDPSYRDRGAPVGRARGLVFGRVVDVNPRYNELRIRPSALDLVRRGRIISTPVICQDSRGEYVPAIHFDRIGKVSRTESKKYIETW